MLTQIDKPPSISILAIFETADYYWRFDQFPEAVKSWQHPNLPNYQFTADAKTLRVPGRPSLVATCDVGKICPSFDGPLPCIKYVSLLSVFAYTARLMPFRLFFPYVPRFDDFTWSVGTHHIALKKWTHFRSKKKATI